MKPDDFFDVLLVWMTVTLVLCSMFLLRMRVLPSVRGILY